MAKGGSRFFTTAPARAIADASLSALELRCLMAIAFSDGMSSTKGTGPGCYAKHATLAAMVGTDVTNFSKALSRLLAKDYVTREPQAGDKRRFTLRVNYPLGDSWRNDQQSASAEAPNVVGETTNNRPEIVGETANDQPKVVGDPEGLKACESEIISSHYIPLNGELYSVETDKLNSDESAQSEIAARDAVHIDDHAAKSRERSASRSAGQKEDAAEAGLGRVSIYPLLPRSFAKVSFDAQLCQFEKAFSTIGREADHLESRERAKWSDWLYAIFDERAGEPAGQQALRLYEEIAA